MYQLHVPYNLLQEVAHSLTFQSLAIFLLTTRLNIQKFYTVLALRPVFCADLRTDSGLCSIRH